MLHEANYLRLLLGLGAALGGDRRVTVLRARHQPQERATLEASARALGLELTVLEGPGQSRALLRALRRGAVVVRSGMPPGMHVGPVASQPVLGRPLPLSTGPFASPPGAPMPFCPWPFCRDTGLRAAFALPRPTSCSGAPGPGCCGEVFSTLAYPGPGALAPLASLPEPALTTHCRGGSHRRMLPGH